MSDPMTGAAPAWWRDRSFTLAEVSHQTGAPVDSINGWLRMARAMGFEVGRKVLGSWQFSPHELWSVHLLAALYRLGVPVSPETIRVFMTYSLDHSDEAPTGPLPARRVPAAGVILVDAARLWSMTLVQCQAVIDAGSTLSPGDAVALAPGQEVTLA